MGTMNNEEKLKAIEKYYKMLDPDNNEVTIEQKREAYLMIRELIDFLLM